MYQAYPIANQTTRDRFGFFQAIVADVFCPMHVQPRPASWQSFRGCVETADFGSVQLARVATSACIVRRRTEDIARMRHTPYLVKFQLKGESFWTQRKSEIHLRPGDFVVCSTAEPYSLRFRDDYDMSVLALSADMMRRLTPDPDRFLGVRMNGEDIDCSLLTQFVAQVVARMSRLQKPMLVRVEATILDLLGGVLSARAEESTLSATSQLVRIKQFVNENLHDRTLGPATIATQFGISTRHVHALFEHEPMTVARYIRSQRAHACRRALERQPGGESLTDVALTWGFYDLSHMSRCFREEFGSTPGRIRAQAGCAPAANPPGALHGARS